MDIHFPRWTWKADVNIMQNVLHKQERGEGELNFNLSFVYYILLHKILLKMIFKNKMQFLFEYFKPNTI